MNQTLGKRAEEKALHYLLQQGLQLLTRNYNCRLGEIDLIMRDKTSIVFVEVRSRSPSPFGDGVESITTAKKQKIIKAASHYLLKTKLLESFPMRFDVIAVDNRSGSITWITDAFGSNY